MRYPSCVRCPSRRPCLATPSGWYSLTSEISVLQGQLLGQMKVWKITSFLQPFQKQGIKIKYELANSEIRILCNFTFHCLLFVKIITSYFFATVFDVLNHDTNQSVTFVKILIRMNVRIYSYQQNYTNEYPNIFILFFLTRTNVRISIHIENCTNIRIYSNIRLGFTL